MKKINIAQFGVGYWGPNLLRALNKSDKFIINYVSEISRSRKDYVENNFQDIKVLNDYKQILINKSIEAIIIATPAYTHFDLVMESLESNKHVLV